MINYWDKIWWTSITCSKARLRPQVSELLCVLVVKQVEPLLSCQTFLKTLRRKQRQDKEESFISKLKPYLKTSSDPWHAENRVTCVCDGWTVKSQIKLLPDIETLLYHSGAEFTTISQVMFISVYYFNSSTDSVSCDSNTWDFFRLDTLNCWFLSGSKTHSLIRQTHTRPDNHVFSKGTQCNNSNTGKKKPILPLMQSDMQENVAVAGVTACAMKLI